MSNQRNDPTYDLCQFQFANGKCCGMPAHPKFNGLCLNHGTMHKRTSVTEDEMASPTGEFHSAADVNNAQGKLFRALAGNRVSTRHGGS